MDKVQTTRSHVHTKYTKKIQQTIVKQAVAGMNNTPKMLARQHNKNKKHKFRPQKIKNEIITHEEEAQTTRNHAHKQNIQQEQRTISKQAVYRINNTPKMLARKPKEKQKTQIS